MAKLENRFSWSFSAAADFEVCRRRRYWGKYAMWGGWEKSAPEIARKAYRLNKMDTRHTLKGNAVEQAIMWILREAQAGRRVDADTAYEQVARPYLNTAWKESRAGAWKSNPKKHCCLHEHYYRHGRTPPEKEWTEALVKDVRQCITHFIERALPRLEHVKPEQEIQVATVDAGGDPESFEFEGIKVYAIPDYVYREGDMLHIHDWKSGRAKVEHRDQVALYGLWANVRHQAEPENIVIYLEYLREGKVAFEQVSGAMLEAVRESIRDSVASMSDYLVGGDRARNEPLPKEDWELAPTRMPCTTCNFYELCAPELDSD